MSRGSGARRDERSNGKQSHKVESRKKTPKLATKIVGCSGRVENVVLDYRFLKYIPLKNCHVVKIHQIVKFKLSHYLRNYARNINEKRHKATSKSEIQYCKNKLNLFYGSTLVQKHLFKQAVFIYNEKQLKKQIKKKSFEGFVEFSPQCGIAFHQPLSYKADVPILIASTILQLGKMILYRQVYDIQAIALDRHYLSMSVIYLDTDAYWLQVHDKTCPKAPVKSDGSRLPWASWMLTQEELERKRALRKHAIAHAWGGLDKRAMAQYTEQMRANDEFFF